MIDLRALNRVVADAPDADAGARCYLMSLELEMENFLERQFGDELPALRALKDRHDPKRLLNRWLL